MILQSQRHEPCGKCGSYLKVQDTIYGCDHCRFEIEGCPITVSFPLTETNPEEYDFCSWECVSNFERDKKE